MLDHRHHKSDKGEQMSEAKQQFVYLFENDRFVASGLMRPTLHPFRAAPVRGETGG